jgi:type IV pilus assembly protein PilN
MIRINLLPHREEKRKARRQQFYALAGLLLALGGLLVFAVHSVIGGYIGRQDEKNGYLKAEIASLDKQIDEIKRLREQTDALLSRKQVIETLQSSRAETVHLFNELAFQTPSGTYVRSLKQSGGKVMLAGYAQSNARVSTLMRNLDASAFLQQPELAEIKAATVANRRTSDFTLSIAITRTKSDDGAKEPKAGPSEQAGQGGKKT